MRKHQLVLIALILAATFLGISGARRTFLGLDFIIAGDEAARFISSGTIPQKACFSSFGSYIPPGISWLEVPGYALHRPLFSMVPSSAVLFIATLVGIYLLGKACGGPWVGCAAAALFGFSASGMFWAQSFWPRGMPVFYAWTACFTIWWIKHRQSRYLFGALLAVVLGLYIHLEFIFAPLGIVAAWCWFRPPLGRSAIAAAVVCGLIIWLPYLRFEASRQFQDLRSQLFQQYLPVLNTNTQWPGMIEQRDDQTHLFKTFNQSTTSVLETRRGPLTILRQFLPSAYSNFRKSRPIATTLIAISVTFLAVTGLAFKSSWPTWATERRDAITTVCFLLFVPWVLLSAFAPPNAPFRQWGLWSLQSVLACVGVAFLFSRPIGRWVALALVFTWLISDGKNCATIAASIAREGWAGRECPEAEICDIIARDSPTSTPRVGYLIIFQGFEIGRAPQDPTQKIGIQFDRYLLWRYGIENRTKDICGYGDGDQYRIFQTIPEEPCRFRFKPDLRGFAMIAKADGFELWKRQAG